jgi:hypothetical protein
MVISHLERLAAEGAGGGGLSVGSGLTITHLLGRAPKIKKGGDLDQLPREHP